MKGQAVMETLMLMGASVIPVHQAQSAGEAATIMTVTTEKTHARHVHHHPSGTAVRFGAVFGMAMDATGNLYFADIMANDVRKIAPDGTISTVAGSGIPGYSGDGGPAVQARLNHPWGIAVDAAGALWIADTVNHRIRYVSPDGRITTMAGNGSDAYCGDGGPADRACLAYPRSVALDASGNLYIADLFNHRIRRVRPDGTIGTVAGNGSSGFSGDGGPAVGAQLWEPCGITVDAHGNLYLIQNGDGRIRRVDAGTGMITTVAGGGPLGPDEADGGSALRARLDIPQTVTVDARGDLYIADSMHGRIRKVEGTTGIITTVVGGGTRAGARTEGCQALEVRLDPPGGVLLDGQGNLFVASNGFDRRLRKVSALAAPGLLAGCPFPEWRSVRKAVAASP